MPERQLGPMKKHSHLIIGWPVTGRHVEGRTTAGLRRASFSTRFADRQRGGRASVPLATRWLATVASGVRSAAGRKHASRPADFCTPVGYAVIGARAYMRCVSRGSRSRPRNVACAKAHNQRQYCTAIVTRRLSARLAGSVPATSGKLSARPIAARRCASTPRSTR